MGKTSYCQYLFGDPEKMLVLNCDGCILPDLVDFSREQGHMGITFDEGTPQLILRHKRHFQCQPYSIVVKKSATEFNKSDVMLSGIRIIVTTNTWTEFLALCTESEKRWLGKCDCRRCHASFVPGRGVSTC